MSTRAGAVPLSDLQFLKIYFNRKRLRSTPANLRKMLAETGGDAICNGSIFLRDLSPACHLKADGMVRKAPDYQAWAVSWNTPDSHRHQGWAVRLLCEPGAAHAGATP